jgi:biotin carboxyl carrier protein
MAMIDVPAPMAGSIKEILVAAGDKVDEGQEVIILESMKMEIPVESPSAGTVTEVLVEAATAVEEGQALIKIEA